MNETAKIELLHSADCPLVDQVRATLETCLSDSGITTEVQQRQGPFASPTLLINGADVVTGAPARMQASCRLDLPTRGHILQALRRIGS